VIELRDVSVGYDDRLVLDRASYRIGEGELVVVAGPTGAGKSTLLGTITGLVPRFSGGRLSGRVLVDGADLTAAPPRDRAHLVGFAGQDPAAGFVTDTVEEELAYGMEQLGLAPATMRRRVEETLDLMGIAGLRSRELRTLSGGEQQRVAIGAVLTMHPRVLVLDEPTSALDPTAAEEVLATLTRLVHDGGLSVILAEHRLERVLPFADTMAVLPGDGRLLGGTPEELVPTLPIAPPIVELGLALDWVPLPLTVRDARRRLDRSRLGPPPERDDREPGRDLIRGRGLLVSHDDTVALRGVDISQAAGTVTALMGRNGSGKSSLLWALHGSRRTAGSVLIGDLDPARLAPAARRQAAGLVPQTPADLLYLESVSDECLAADESASAVLGTCRALLDRLMPGIDESTHPRDLSEGQRLALVLAIVVTASPRVVLLDEPTRGLDYAAKRALAEALSELAAGGHAVLVATHDVEFAAIAADRVVVLAEGEVVSAGPAHRVLAESPAFAPQVAKVLGPAWLTVDEVRAAEPAR
jgi:energy-coupling factor transport system ATP-binding protein